MKTKEIIFLALSLFPFLVLLIPYTVVLKTKIKVEKYTHIAVWVTFTGLLTGVYFVYDEYIPGSSMTGIIFVLWPFFAALGAIPTYFIAKYIAKYFVVEIKQ